MKELPKKFKKQIIAFCREFEKIAVKRIVKVNIPAHTEIVEVCWASDYTVDVEYAYPGVKHTDLNQLKEIQSINISIKDFCKRTTQFGKEYFKNPDWMWENILWDYRPENGDKFNSIKYKWI
jgi:hypothetical protein